MKIYGLKACDTCRAAMRALTSDGCGPILVDVRADGISPDTLARFLSALGEDLVNRRSTTWRGLSDEERTRDPLDLLADYPALMKRPVIEDGAGRLTLGWSDAIRASVTGTGKNT